MTSYAVIAVLIATVMLLGASVRVDRYSRGHMIVRATLAGRGLYVSKTADGVRCTVRVRRRSCPPTSCRPDHGPPQLGGVREPRRPVGPGPLSAADAIDPLASG